jgi:hypothetical protein
MKNHRLLNDGEIILETDQVYVFERKWITPQDTIGMPYSQDWMFPMRRKFIGLMFEELEPDAKVDPYDLVGIDGLGQPKYATIRHWQPYDQCSDVTVENTITDIQRKYAVRGVKIYRPL